MLDLDAHKTTDQIPLRIDEQGTVRIGTTEVTLDVVMAAYDRGATAEQIAQKFGELALADVYAVIGYCLRHETEIREYLAKREQEASRLRVEIEGNPANKKFRERLANLKRK
jgi:uncharacterized protein (DUF433 family)